MEEMYNNSLQMIKELNIKDEITYSQIAKEYLILNIVSLKYMARTNNFNRIIKKAEEV